MNPWISTFTGKQFHICGNDPDEIDIIDIAHANSMQCRFTGHVSQFYSVGSHQLFVAKVIQLMGGSWMEQLEGLMHDAPEAYMHDMAKPWKILMPIYRFFERKTDRRIRRKFGLPAKHSPLMKQADNLALFAEAEVLLPREDLHAWPGYLEYAMARSKIKVPEIPFYEMDFVKQHYLEAFDFLQRAIND